MHPKKIALSNLLSQWGEVIVVMASGKIYEIHLGDDIIFDDECCKVKTPNADIYLFYDDIESIKTHYAHEADLD